MGLSPNEVVHVGDCLEADYLGASQAGLHGVWLDRAGVNSRANSSIIAITNLRQLPGVIKSIGNETLSNQVEGRG